MKKNRLILLLNVSVVALTPSVHGQDVADAMQSADDVVKLQLEQFADDKSALTDTSNSESNVDASEKTSQDQAEADVLSTEAPVTDDATSSESSLPVIETKQDEQSQDASTPVSETEKDSTSTQQETAPQEIEVPEKPEPYGPASSSSNDAATTEEAPAQEEQGPVEVSAPLEQPLSESPEVKETPVVREELVHVQEPQPVESLLDTIDIEDGGNWVLKRKALQDTVRKVEDINALYDDIRDTNIVFLQGINSVDSLFTQFTYDVGLDLGKVDQLVQDVAHHLESEREQVGDLSEAERELLLKAEERKKEIEQLRTNIQDIWQANAQLKEARGLNDEQIIEADRLRKQAWRNFREIERVLNEVRAEELYHETVQLFEALQTSYRYLQTRLIPHFEQSIKTIQAKMQTVKQQSEDLQKEGVLLREEAAQLHHLEKQTSDEVQEEPVQTGGWFSTIKSILWAPFGAVGTLWGWITGSSNDMSKYLPDDAESAESAHPEEL